MESLLIGNSIDDLDFCKLLALRRSGFIGVAGLEGILPAGDGFDDGMDGLISMLTFFRFIGACLNYCTGIGSLQHIPIIIPFTGSK